MRVHVCEQDTRFQGSCFGSVRLNKRCMAGLCWTENATAFSSQHEPGRSLTSAFQHPYKISILRLPVPQLSRVQLREAGAQAGRHTAGEGQGRAEHHDAPKQAGVGGRCGFLGWRTFWEGQGDRREGEGTRQAPTCQAEGAEDELGAVEDGEAAVFLLADGFRTLEVLGVLPRADFLYFHDIH